MMWREPKRLLDGDGTQDALRLALRTAQQQVGDDARVGRLHARLADLGPASAASGTAGALGAAGAVKVGLSLFGAVIVGAVVFQASTPPDDRRRTDTAAQDEAGAPVAVVAATPSPQAATAEAPAPATPEAAVVGPAGVPARAPADRAAKGHRGARDDHRAVPVVRRRHDRAPQLDDAGPSAAKPKPRAVADPAAELQLVQRAQRILERHPQGALQVLDTHAREFPDGVFAQERESLAFDALRKLGYRDRARRRARRFLSRFPKSPHRRRIDAWLLEHDAPANKKPDATDHKDPEAEPPTGR